MSLTISPERIVAESQSPLLAAPIGWPRRPLGEVATIINGFAFKSKQFSKDGGMPLIRIRDIRSDRTAVGYLGVYDERYLVGPGDLLVGMDGDFNCARWAGSEALLNQRICKVVPGPDLNIDYLTFVLPGYLRALHDSTSSTTVTHLSSKDVARIPIPVPDARTQAQIAASLGRTSKRVSTVKSQLARARILLHRLRASTLEAAISGRLTADWRESHTKSEGPRDLVSAIEAGRPSDLGRRLRANAPEDNDLPQIPEEWCWAALPELGEVGRGKSRHRPRNDPNLYGGAYPFIQTGDVARSDGRIRSHSQAYNEAGLAQSRLWPAGTVCITIAANIAESALLAYPACFPDSVVGIITDTSIALPEYVEMFIRTAKRDLAAFAPATAQANINLAILSELAVPLPPVAEQQVIVRRTEKLVSTLDTVARRIAVSERIVQGGVEATLAKAFRGELLVDVSDRQATV